MIHWAFLIPVFFIGFTLGWWALYMLAGVLAHILGVIHEGARAWRL